MHCYTSLPTAPLTDWYFPSGIFPEQICSPACQSLQALHSMQAMFRQADQMCLAQARYRCSEKVVKQLVTVGLQIALDRAAN